MQHFDPIDSPLTGVNLIEASAGTGKTYTIATAVTRLVIEQALGINQILVVTFTEAATEELRDRIRCRLQETHAAFLENDSDDIVLKGLVEKYADIKTQAAEHLKNALRGFDEAPIFTIHGFCQRTLQENAFESGALFDTELVADQSGLIQEIVEDFWRLHFYQTPSLLFVDYALAKGYSPDKLLEILGNHAAKIFLKIIPDDEAELSGEDWQAATESAYRKTFEAVQQAWPAASAELEIELLQHSGLNRNKYRKSEIPKWIAEISDLLRTPADTHVPALLGLRFEKFCTNTLAESCKKGQSPPQHPFFDLCQTLKDAETALHAVYNKRLLKLKRALFEYAGAELRKRKQQHNIQSFDDLLLNLYYALHSKGGQTLARAIQHRYPAALIDEFQDTDPLQYAIFHKIYGVSGRYSGEAEDLAPEKTHRQSVFLFLIGDPKQAIYSFRGADIFTYMQAAGDADRQYTLGANWRSAPELVSAVNAFFGRVQHPFIYDKIPFHPVQAARRSEGDSSITEARRPPLQLWYIDREMAGISKGLISKAWAYENIPVLVAGEIAHLLNSGPEYGKQAGDIAVLVRTNRQAAIMQQALRARKIPSVLYSRENLFESHEAEEMERVLAAVLEPERENLLRAALAADMLGMSGDALFSLLQDEERWEELLERFRGYHELWRDRGFIQMFRTLQFKEKVQSRLLDFSNGERRLTNLLHLAEVLQQASLTPKRGMLRLFKWLAEMRRRPDAAREELRLESDENAVKLVTIHKSKGLEYPAVFVPFAWDGALRAYSAEQFTFHDPDKDSQLFLDLGSADREDNRKHAAREELAESLRLLYVAITRAKYYCYLVWGPFKDAQTSAPGHLFHSDTPFSQESDAALLKHLYALAAASTGNIHISRPPAAANQCYRRPDEAAPNLAARSFTGKIAADWRVTSFTALTSRRYAASGETPHAAVEQPDRDAQSRNVRQTEGDIYASIFNFPGGVRAGRLFHELFENLDFQQTDPAVREKLSENLLKEYGYVPQWRPALCTLLDKVLSTQLEPELTLSQIAWDSRLNELEFYYPLENISASGLARVFARSSSEITLPRFFSVKGFMKGFIDMVFVHRERFYLADYKSNWLGSAPENYRPQKLLNAMQEHNYILQYHIYCVALHRYLAMRLPDYDYTKHFGGVYYMFLRGMDPEYSPENGIFRDKPAPELILALSDYLEG
ncbi:MAG: exodeoxyribonuclease V subunit beta [Gammaproteobacteria bacterium]|nr:exodeoxyribonuclease V subunit beta [Gammaproteobacteria bacterium]